MGLALTALLASMILLPFVGAWGFCWRVVEWLTHDSRIHAGSPAIDVWQQAATWAIFFGIAAVIVWRLGSPWLAAGVAFAIPEMCQKETYADALILTFFALGIAGARHVPRAYQVWALRGLSLGALAIAATVLAQAAGVDPWFGLAWARNEHGVHAPGFPPGPFGISGLAAAYLAVTGLLLPGLALPIIALALYITHSAAAIVAFAVGLALRTRSRLLAVGLALLAGVTVYQHGLASLRLRLGIAELALQTWLAGPQELGFGLGAWSRHPLDPPAGHAAWDHGLAWASLHNDWLQYGYERGTFGVLILIGWLVSERARWRHPVLAPSCVALALIAAAWPVLHTYAFGFVTLILVGVRADTTPSLWTGATA